MIHFNTVSQSDIKCKLKEEMRPICITMYNIYGQNNSISAALH